MASPAQEIFVVRRAETWELKPFWYGVWHYRCPRKDGVVRAFTSRERAERVRKTLEQRVRDKPPGPGCNPFICSRGWEMEYDQITSFPEPVFDDWLRDQGLTPATPHFPDRQRSSSDWYHWWRSVAGTLIIEQRREIWKGFDQVRFYEIVALRLE